MPSGPSASPKSFGQITTGRSRPLRTPYLAFDAGEYCHTSDPASTDPEVKYTRSLIDALLAERSQP